MNKKISLGVTVGLLCLAIAITGAITMSVVSRQYNNILKGLPEKLERYELLDELDKVINNNYYGNKTEENLEVAIAQGYVSGLGDNYSKYLTAEEYAQYVAENEGDMSGIGIEYSKYKKKYIMIDDVYDGSPAQNAGLQQGDIIVAFDGIMLDSANYKEMAQKLGGDKLTSVNLTYRRDSKDTTVNIVKGYEAQSVMSDTYGNIGYLKISNFYTSTASQVQKAVDMFVSSGIEGIVVDVRKNSSTNYDVAMDVLDIFVPMNDENVPAATVSDENGNIIKTYTTTSGEISIPVVVLVNEKTAAAAELFAADMQDFGKAELVGSSTAGIGLIRDVFRFTDGSTVLLSVGIVKPYRSETYNSVGVSDVSEIELEKETKKLSSDTQFIYAVSLLSKNTES